MEEGVSGSMHWRETAYTLSWSLDMSNQGTGSLEINCFLRNRVRCHRGGSVFTTVHDGINDALCT